MTTKNFSSIEEAHAAIMEAEIARRKGLTAATVIAAEKGAQYLREHVPVAFGELRDSIHVITSEDDIAVVVDAPHAQDVEIGSRPHLVPLEDLVKWVKLRGMQYQTGYSTGTTSDLHAVRIGTSLAMMENADYLDIDAPEKIARAIQKKILREGTVPHWYARDASPKMAKMLWDEIRKVGR